MDKSSLYRDGYFQVEIQSLSGMADHRHDYSPSLGQMTDKPLFGVSKWRDRVVNTSFAVLTSLIVSVTVISAFIFPHWPPLVLNVFFAVCISLMCMSHITLIHWYNEGGVDPKFRILIYFNTVLILLFCVCANCYYHL
ncbi:transmembrane protein 243 [Trichonephila inaurata madagascariensis]|uniref:Transmembrane protein 243 n=1 Tax=Trichonephila inaurata madagascariensis TaxID=2747483 RepID=A0A8X6XG73_9ARAC|nr:transmembrane protein 243 [Trichonephila inaurata madagascariensis]